jgi:Uma2 family endonuclease
MVDRQDLAELILEQTDAPLIIQRVQEKLKEEQRKREEFYELIDEDTKAEFINGEIVYHSPDMKRHNDATGYMYTLLRTYVEGEDLGFVGVEKILTVFSRNDYEPDVCFFNKKKAKNFQLEQMKFPIPDLAVEVLSKSKRALERDRKIKFEDYEKHGVSEYWMIDPDEETVEQHVLRKGKFELVLKSGERHITSHAVKGFTVPIRAKAHRQALRDLLK